MSDNLDPPSADTTGDARVDAALRVMESLERLPVSEHVAAYTDVHRRLQDALAALDEG